jgi:small subunit ribosomal protein S8
MSLVDPLADALINLKNRDTAAKQEAFIRPATRIMGEILRVMKEAGYINTFEFVEDGRQGVYKVDLGGRLNNCRAIKPRYAVKKDEFEKYEKRYLPSRDIGVLIVSTSQGVLTHQKAKEQGVGGRLLAYIY